MDAVKTAEDRDGQAVDVVLAEQGAIAGRERREGRGKGRPHLAATLLLEEQEFGRFAACG